MDFIETVTHRLGNFYSSSRVVTGPPGPEFQLTTDAKALQAFIDRSPTLFPA